MQYLRLIARLIGLSQIILGLLYFAWPLGFIAWQGLTPVAADTGYPLAMLAARFLVYGVGMFAVASDPARHAFWLFGMVAIQLIDLAAGAAYVATGVVAWQHALVPMVNATLFAAVLGGLGLAVLRPNTRSAIRRRRAA